MKNKNVKLIQLMDDNRKQSERFNDAFMRMLATFITIKDVAGQYPSKLADDCLDMVYKELNLKC